MIRKYELARFLERAFSLDELKRVVNEYSTNVANSIHWSSLTASACDSEAAIFRHSPSPDRAFFDLLAEKRPKWKNEINRLYEYYRSIEGNESPDNKPTPIEKRDPRPGWRDDWAPPARAPAAALSGIAFDTGVDNYGSWLRFEVSGIVQRMRWVPAGTFSMGSPEEEAGRYLDEGPRHCVTLSRGFWLGATPCTRALWSAVMEDVSVEEADRELPMTDVTWHECVEFLSRLNDRAPGLHARMPTEAEWEYACRAGTNSALYGSLDSIAWHIGNSGRQAHPVASKQANAWGLFDMLGNSRDWCSDGPRRYDERHQLDPVGPLEDQRRVLRGGGWNGKARKVRAAARYLRGMTGRNRADGLRLARDAREKQ